MPQHNRLHIAGTNRLCRVWLQWAHHPLRLQAQPASTSAVSTLRRPQPDVKILTLAVVEVALQAAHTLVDIHLHFQKPRRPRNSLNKNEKHLPFNFPSQVLPGQILQMPPHRPRRQRQMQLPHKAAYLLAEAVALHMVEVRAWLLVMAVALGLAAVLEAFSSLHLKLRVM